MADLNLYSPDQVAEWSSGKKIINPIRDMLPKDVQESTLWFWMFYSDILKGKIGLCTRVRMFLADGLTADDLKVIFKSMTRPNVAAGFEYAGQMLAALCQAVDDYKIQQKQKREQAELKVSNGPFATESNLAQAVFGIGGME